MIQRGIVKQIIFLLFIFLNSVSNAQDTVTVKFYNFITEDSVVMFFDNKYHFTSEACARFRRHTKLDTLGNFNGSFTDYQDNVTVGRGSYNHGIKEGMFETFYENGRIKSQGSFKNNRPAGYWNYFYADGKTEKQLLFNAADTFLIEYFDAGSKHLIKGGNGHYKGLVGVVNDSHFGTVATAEGNIVNGKPDGIWTTRLGGGPFYTENFMKGIFISGRIPERLAKDRNEYSDFSNLYILYQPDYIYRLEEFHIEECDAAYANLLKQKNANKKNNKANSYTDFTKVQSYVQDAIHNVIASDMRNGNNDDYRTGENVFKLSFTINSKETPADFKRLTSWGDQFFYPVTNALSMHLKMPPTNAVIYLVVTITKDASNYLTSRFYFSNE